MHSNRQPALLGATRLNLKISSSSITAKATLGGVAKMKAFVYLFPPGLVLFLALINSFFSTGGSWWYVLIVLPWILIAPLIGRALERSTTTAVDRLVRGMAQAKKS